MPSTCCSMCSSMCSSMFRAALVAMLLPAGPAIAGKKNEAAQVLARDHTHPSGGLSFKCPEGWAVQAPPTDRTLIEAAGDGVVIRFFLQPTETGLDSLHVDCMSRRLAGGLLDADPRVKYEYDFNEGEILGRRALDSAFVVRYDEPIAGQREWRQRNVTIVGGGQSVCAIVYAPVAVWKKSAHARRLADAILGSVVFR